MKIIIAKNSQAVDYIIPHLDQDDDVEAEVLGEQLKNAYKSGADNIFLGMIMDGVEVKAFVLAYDIPGQTYVHIYQAWADPSFTLQSWKDSMFLRLVMWAEARGMSELRAETRRSPEAFLRKWGFENHSTVLSYRIPENFEEELLAGREMFRKSRKSEPAEPENVEITEEEVKKENMQAPDKVAEVAEPVFEPVKVSKDG